MLRSLAAAARSPASLRRFLHAAGGGGGEEVESVAYRMSMLRAPPVVRKAGLPTSSCSLIGRVRAPVRPFADSSDELPRAFTFLSVPCSSLRSSTSSHFCVTLHFKGEMANVGLKHLKQNDLVYVSGTLDSYHKVDPSGEKHIFYKNAADRIMRQASHQRKYNE
uniref:Single-stranded DNA-binding protein n=1 Tax=Leersia perrieri TaxID=77586 RepID=A0A0D9VWD4_9ORYZ